MSTSRKSALRKAEEIQLDAKSLGFDWPEPAPVFDKVAEELEEVKEALEQQSQAHTQEELGDLLFAVVNLARHLKINSEQALHEANDKFSARFEKVKALATEQGIDMRESDLDTLEKLWSKVKEDDKGK